MEPRIIQNKVRGALGGDLEAILVNLGGSWGVLGAILVLRANIVEKCRFVCLPVAPLGPPNGIANHLKFCVKFIF